jgi:hypothetical protein
MAPVHQSARRTRAELRAEYIASRDDVAGDASARGE